jgi:tRNA-modifying protein YgfZ
MASEQQSVTEQARSIAQRAGFWLREDLTIVRVQGDDRLTWLNGQVTNDLRALESGSTNSVRALAVHVKGKILADVWVVARPDELLIMIPKSASAALLESFERYIIMEDVTLSPWPEVQVLSVVGPEAAQLAAAIDSAGPAGSKTIAFSCDELGIGGYAFVGEPSALASIAASLGAAGVVPVTRDAYELARLRAGVPRFGSDFGDRSYPQEAGLKQLVSFAKGCYLGQEVVCTLENRGKLSRHLAVFRGTAADGGEVPAPGTSLKTASDESPGEVTSAVYDPESGAVLALGYVKRAHAVPGTTLTAAGTHLTLQRVVGES